MNEDFDRRRRRLVRGTLLVLLAVLAGGGVVFLAVTPPTLSRLYPSCPIQDMTGWHCPGCGLTRALHSLFNGDLRQAVAWNALGLLLLPYVSLSLIRSLWSWAWHSERGT